MGGGGDATYLSRTVTLPTPAPTVPPLTVLPLTAMFTPNGPDTGYAIQYVRLCIPQSALTRTFQIKRFHYNYYFDESEGDVEGSSDDDAGDPWAGIETDPHTVSWDGRSERGTISPSGVYFVRLEWRDHIRTQKLVLMR